MKLILPILILVIMFSCNSVQDEVDLNNINQTENSFEFSVEYSGALKKIMHESDVSAYADLRDFSKVENFYAIGAVEGLKGEILILDGVPYISSVDDEHIQIDDSFDLKASLLVHTSVQEWAEYVIPDEIRSYEELEEFIAQTAEENGIAITEPFPFLLQGVADTVDWHVINWPEGDTVHTHEKHINSGLSGIYENIDVEILGFYSDSHHAIFTHHTTNMHLHFISTDRKKTGHVDGLVLGQEMNLLLPRTK